jgi:hypothetical protein
MLEYNAFSTTIATVSNPLETAGALSKDKRVLSEVVFSTVETLERLSAEFIEAETLLLAWLRNSKHKITAVKPILLDFIDERQLRFYTVSAM